MTEVISLERVEHLLQLFEQALGKQHFSEDQLDHLVQVGSLIEADVIHILHKYSVPDKRFGSNIFRPDQTFTVPYDFDPEAHYQKMIRMDKKHPHYEPLRFENFSQVSHVPIPGKTYGLKGYRLADMVPAQECLQRLRIEPRYLFVGGFGVSLLHEYQPELLPVGKWVVSFDEQEMLWKDQEGHHRVPQVLRHKDGTSHFNLCYLGLPLLSQQVIICFYDLDDPHFTM